MKTTRVFATACLLVSSVALVTAARISVGDEPGVVRLSSQSPQGGGYGSGAVPAPTPDSMGAMGGAGVASGDPIPADSYPQPGPYAPYFDRTFGATEMVQAPAYQDPQPFGPLLMFEQNIDDGLGYDQAYTRVNTRLPFHLIPNTTVLLGDFSASVTSDGDPIFSGGAIYRNYDAMRNRIFGINGYFDYDEGRGFGDYSRATAGFESLGKYIDFRGNGYFILGDEGTLMSDTIIGNPFFTGNNVARTRRQVWENAYSGADLETGGPIPLLGRYGLNAYAGAYYLTSDQGSDTVGFQARWEALITQSVTVNTYLTTDDDFGTNSWVSMQYTIPNYRNKRFLRPVAVRDRLQDPVIRSNRIVTNVDTNLSRVALLNKHGLAYNVIHVNPNATAAGTGTFENPFNTFQQAATANNALVDTIRVIPRNDDTGTNLTANGGITLFDCQTLMSSTKDLTFRDFGGTTHTIPGVPTLSNLGPLISNPNMLAGGSVVRLADQNTVLGMRINAANSAGTVFGTGISNAAPITDVTLSMNTFTNYTVGANVQDVTGNAIIDANTFTGRTGTSTNGLLFSSATGQTVELLVRGNTATNNSTSGLSVTAKSGSTINADNPAAFGPVGTLASGVVGNVVSGNGNGIEMTGDTGSTINAVVENNTATTNTANGFVGRTDGGVFNLASLSSNTLNRNGENGAFLHYLNGGSFRSVSEDLNRNGLLNAGEDLNGNGRLDRGIISNSFNSNSLTGLCIFGEDSVDDGAAGAGTPDSLGRFDVGAGTGAIGSAGSGNDFFGNGAAGIAYDLTGFATGQIDALNNDIRGELRGLNFLIDGNTFTQPFLLTNTSASLDITRLTLDILPSGNIWDTTSAVPGSAFVPFQPLSNSDVTTGLTSVNGTLIAQGTNPLTAFDGGALVGGGVADGTASLDLAFAGFNPAEAFTWDLDSDPVGFPDGTTSGDDLIGSTIQLQFSDGSSLGGSLQAVTGNPDAAEFVATSGASIAHGIVIRGTDNTVLEASTIHNNRIDGNGRWGVEVAMLDSAQARSLDLKANTITNNGDGGLRLHADGPGAFIDASQTIGGTGTVDLGAGNIVSAANQFVDNQGDGLQFHAENGGVIRGNVINNQIRNNVGNGIAMQIDNGGEIDFGTPVALPAQRIISGNTITGNTEAGIRMVSNASASTTSVMDALVQGNNISTNAAGGIVSQLNGPNHIPPALPAVVQNNILNLTVGGALESQANTLNQNGDVGIGVNVAGNGLANVDIRNATITGTTNGADPILNGDAINLRRADASLLLATIEDVTATANLGDGLDVDVQGNDKNDPNQPLVGTVNSVEWNRNNFSNNGQNGARFRTRGDAMLLADAQTNTVSNNGQNGIQVQTSETSSFGDPTDGLAPGRRVVFDGNTIEQNGVDGVQILASNDSRALVEITSTAIPPASGAHAALSSLGITSISRNVRDGIHLETTGGRSDILVTSNTGETIIDGNGTGSGGNGIRWDASGSSDASLRVTRTQIINNIAGAAEGADANNNGDIDVADGDGIQFNITATNGIGPGATLVVGGTGAGDGNVIQGNGDDGIAITAIGNDVVGSPRPIISIISNEIGGIDDVDGNQGDGISLNIFGGTRSGTDIGADPGSIDASIADGDGLTFSGGVQQNGPIVQMTVSDNLIASNNRKGVNLLLTGAAGERNRESGSSFFDPVRITLTDNTIVSNGEQGVFFRGDSQMNQSRLTYLANFPFPNPPFDPADNRPQSFGFYTPTQAEFLSSNVGSVNGNSAFGSSAPDGALGYLNFRTVQNTFLTVTGNSIQNNGTNTVVGEGLFIQVGTGSYLAADVRDNAMGGNLNSDFRTESFLSLDQTFDSVENSGDGTFDVIYWDDTAQMDLRFQNNSGNQINVAVNNGATYSNPDSLKSIALGGLGVLDRDVAFFQVDNGANLNDPNNTFINFGITQTIDASFTAGGYNLRAAADAAFPNIGFAPFLP